MQLMLQLMWYINGKKSWKLRF